MFRNPLDFLDDVPEQSLGVVTETISVHKKNKKKGELGGPGTFSTGNGAERYPSIIHSIKATTISPKLYCA